MALTKILTTLVILVLCHSTLAANYDPKQAYDYAAVSALSYCSTAMLKNKDCGALNPMFDNYTYYFDMSKDLKLTSSEMTYIMVYNTEAKRFVTAFKGSIDTLQMIQEGVLGGAKKYTLHDVPNAYATIYFYDTYEKVIRESFLSKLKEAYQQFPDYTFVITGHSLGGALATHAAFDVVKLGLISKNKVSLYNYGSPRVGNSAFASAVQNTLGDYWRVVHYDDHIPHVPECFKVIKKWKLQCDAGNGMLKFLYLIPGMWPAWHLDHQVWYDDENRNYKICEAEGLDCANSFKSIDITDSTNHNSYMGIWMHVCKDLIKGRDDRYTF